MAQDNTLARSLHDLGLATWFGGSLMGAVGIKGRLATQRGVAGATVAKAALTGLALGATAYSRALGERLMQAGDAPVEGGTTPTDDAPPDLAGAQRQLTVLQWAIPGLTGTALVLNALMGEQQRPQQVASGLLQGLRSRLPVLALAGTGLWVRARSRRTPPS